MTNNYVNKLSYISLGVQNKVLNGGGGLLYPLTNLNNKTNKIIMDRISLSIFVLEGIMNKQELNKLIGKNVKKYRLLYNTKNKNKMTQAKLSEMLGVHMSLIAALESSNSTQGLSIYNLYQISKILNVRIDKFFEGDV